MPQAKGNDKLSFAEFTRRYIKHARSERSKGIHTVFDKFNEACRKYYSDDFDPVKQINALIDKGIIEGYLTKGGMRIYLKGEMPQAKGKTAESVLSAMGLEF